MRFKGICPKCGGDDIIFVEGSSGAYGAGNNVPATIFTAVLVKRYVCCGCGYSEEWIAQEDIPKLEKRYPKLKKNNPKT